MDDFKRLGEVLSPAIASLTADYHTSHLGRITSYDGANHMASVELATSRPVPLADGGHVFVPYQSLDEVPIMFPGNASKFMRWTPDVGDSVLLVCVMHDPGNWLETGVPGPPGLVRRSALGHAVAFPSFAAGKATGVAGASDGFAIEAPEIKLGTGATDALAKAPAISSIIDAFVNATPVTNDGGLALQTAVKVLWGAPGNLSEQLACTKVKGE